MSYVQPILVVGFVFLVVVGYMTKPTVARRRYTTDSRPPIGSQKKWPLDVQFLARFFISAVLLAACSWVLLSGTYQSEDKNWAYGTIGALAGYWLKA